MVIRSVETRGMTCKKSSSGIISYIQSESQSNSYCDYFRVIWLWPFYLQQAWPTRSRPATYSFKIFQLQQRNHFKSATSFNQNNAPQSRIEVRPTVSPCYHAHTRWTVTASGLGRPSHTPRRASAQLTTWQWKRTIASIIQYSTQTL